MLGRRQNQSRAGVGREKVVDEGKLSKLQAELDWGQQYFTIFI